jgi:hypothetical protein
MLSFKISYNLHSSVAQIETMSCTRINCTRVERSTSVVN